MAKVPFFEVGDLITKVAQHPITRKKQARRGIITRAGPRNMTFTIHWFAGDPEKPEEKWMREEDVILASFTLQKMILLGEYEHHTDE